MILRVTHANKNHKTMKFLLVSPAEETHTKDHALTARYAYVTGAPDKEADAYAIVITQDVGDARSILHVEDVVGSIVTHADGQVPYADVTIPTSEDQENTVGIHPPAL